MFATQFSSDRLIHIKDGDEEPEDLARHVVTRLAAAIQESGGVYKGGRAEKGLAVMNAQQNDRELVIICGLEASNRRDLVVRILANDKLPAYVAVGMFMLSMMVAITVSFLTGFSSSEPLISFVLAAIGSFLLSFGAFTIATEWRAKRQARVSDGDVDEAASLLRAFSEGFRSQNVEISEEKCRIIGVDVSPEHKGPVDGNSVEMRTESVRWTKIFQAALAAVPVE
jgi:hypothetical protein